MLYLLASYTSASTKAEPIVFEDNFNAESPQPVNGFKAYEGNWRTENGNILLIEGGSGPKLVADDSDITTGEVGVEVLFPDCRGINAGLIVKVRDSGNGADKFTGYEVALSVSGQHLNLGKHVQNYKAISQTPCNVPVNEWISLVVRMQKTSLEVLVNGKSIVTYEDPDTPLITGAQGLRVWQQNARFRNMWTRKDSEQKSLVFQTEIPERERHIRKGWEKIIRGSPKAAVFAVRQDGVIKNSLSQEICFTDGTGEVGIRTAGGSGIPVVAGKNYTCRVMARSDSSVDLYISTEANNDNVTSENKLSILPGAWNMLSCNVIPKGNRNPEHLAIKIKSPGKVIIGRVLLQPDDWGWPETLRTETLPPVAFITRYPLSHPNTISCDIWQTSPSSPGCSIRICDPSNPAQAAKEIFSDPDGCIYDMNVSYDAKTLFFSYRGKDERYWHIWKINTDGTGLKQLTNGPFYDVSPCLMPNGEIVFVSTRRFGYTVCQPGPASNLHIMKPDGTSIRCVSMNTLSDFSPQMLPDGRVLFTRWEYIDRDLTFRQSLWVQNPDGTTYQLYFGNTVRDVGTFWQARPLPGRSDKLVATFAPHHHWPHGAIGLIDRTFGVEGDKDKSYTYITKEFPNIGDGAYEWSYRDPFPLSDKSFLCSYGGGGVFKNRLFILNINDSKRMIYEDPQMGCYFPIPLKTMPTPRVIPSRLPADTWNAPTSTIDNATASFILVDVYKGIDSTIERGRAKYLRVMEQIRKTEDLHSRAYDESPVMSYATYYAKRCWGTVPIEEDGSAHFKAPALREIYFQVLDADGRELQRMTSGVQVMPGEQISCVGCHEPRDSSAPVGNRYPVAASKPPSDLKKPDWGNDGIIDFTKLVQPVLDKYCVECHSGTNPKGGYDFSGDKTRYFNMAYDNLLGRSKSYRQHDMFTGEMLPEEKAKGKPLVHFFWLLRTPSGVNQPLWAGSHVSRLTEIIESDHCKKKIPLEDRQKIYMWIDADVPYYATYAHTRTKSPGKRDLFTDPDTGSLSQWFTKDFTGVYEKRCVPCHDRIEGSINWEGKYAWINLTNPHLSPALTAHLPKDKDGRGIDKTKDGKPINMFADMNDPDYLAMLKAIETGKRLALSTPRADMEGYTGRTLEP